QQALSRLSVRHIAEMLPLRVAENACEEHVGVSWIGLEQYDVGARILPHILGHAHLHPRMDDGAKRLRKNERQSAAARSADGGSFNRAALAAAHSSRVERNERIHAEEQIDTFIESEGGVQRLVERAVDEVLAVDPDRRKKPRQRGR